MFHPQDSPQAVFQEVCGQDLPVFISKMPTVEENLDISRGPCTEAVVVCQKICAVSADPRRAPRTVGEQPLFRGRTQSVGPLTADCNLLGHVQERPPFRRVSDMSSSSLATRQGEQGPDTYSFWGPGLGSASPARASVRRMERSVGVEFDAGGSHKCRSRRQVLICLSHSHFGVLSCPRGSDGCKA